MTLRGGSMHIEVPGEPRVESIVDRESFFRYLGDARVPARAQEMARKKIELTGKTSEEWAPARAGSPLRNYDGNSKNAAQTKNANRRHCMYGIDGAMSGHSIVSAARLPVSRDRNGSSDRSCARWSPSGPRSILTSRSSLNAENPTGTARRPRTGTATATSTSPSTIRGSRAWTGATRSSGRTAAATAARARTSAMISACCAGV